MLADHERGAAPPPRAPCRIQGLHTHSAAFTHRLRPATLSDAVAIPRASTSQYYQHRTTPPRIETLRQKTSHLVVWSHHKLVLSVAILALFRKGQAKLKYVKQGLKNCLPAGKCFLKLQYMLCQNSFFFGLIKVSSIFTETIIASALLQPCYCF